MRWWPAGASGGGGTLTFDRLAENTISCRSADHRGALTLLTRPGGMRGNGSPPQRSERDWNISLWPSPFAPRYRNRVGDTAEPIFAAMAGAVPMGCQSKYWILAGEEKMTRGSLPSAFVAQMHDEVSDSGEM